jgi:hypothetical protein
VVSPARATELRAVDERGAPIADATLDATDPLAPCARAPGRRAALAVAAPDGALTATLLPGATLSGRVLSTDGKPIAGARVALARPDGEPDATACATVATSAADGSYRLDGLPSGPRRIVADHRPAHLPSRIMIALAVTEPRRADVRLLAALAARALVTAPDGKPLPAARVRVRPYWDLLSPDVSVGREERTAIEAFSGVTDAGGAVDLPLLPLAASRVTVAHDAFAPASVTVRSGGTVRVPLPRGGSVTLRAVDEAGAPRPTPRARVTSISVADADLLPETFEGSPDGAVLLPRLPPGTYAIDLTAPGSRPRLLRDVKVADGAITALGDVALAPGVALAGFVQDEAGAPVGGAVVSLATWTDGRRARVGGTTDVAGRFRFDGLVPDARADVTAKADGRVPDAARRVLPGGDDVVLTLPLAGAIVVRADDAETGEPVGDFAARALSTQASSREKEPVPALDGEARLGALREGEYRVRVDASGYPRALTDPMAVEPGGEIPVTVRLERGRRIRGLVVEAGTSAAIAGASVALAEDAGTASTPTDADGTFALDGVPPHAGLVVSHPRYQPAIAGPVGLDDDEPLRIELERGGRVAGVVLGRDGSPLAGARVRWQSLGATTGADGRYALDGLKPGSQRLEKVDRADGPDGRETALVDVVAGTTVAHDFGVGPRVEGAVTFRGEPAQGARLSMVQSPTGGPASSETLLTRVASAGEDGSYAMLGVPVGRWSMLVTWQGRRFGRIVQVAEGQAEQRVDVEIPDLHLAGLVVSAETREPIVGATVHADPPTQPGEGLWMTMSDGAGEGDEEGVTVSTRPSSFDITGADGRFVLLLPRRGPTDVQASAPGWMSASNEPLRVDATGSRDDLVIEMRGSAHLTVRIFAAASGAPVEGTVEVQQARSSMMMGGDAVFTFDQIEAGTPAELSAYADGFAPTTFHALELEAGESRTLDALLRPGGDLRLLVPEGATIHVTGDAPAAGAVRLRDSAGVDLLQHGVPAPQETAPGEWLVRHLPEGSLTVERGEGDAAVTRAVDIREGIVAVVDLR